MSLSEREKMQAGAWYCCIDPELEAMRQAARRATFHHNMLPPDERGAMGAALRALLGEVGRDVRIEAPFLCSYGINISLGAAVFINSGCTILDSAPVRIGERALLGPNVHIYCAEHHKEARQRSAGLEIARPVEIGADAWIGGGAILLGGVRVGDGAIVGAGAVVKRDVPPGATVVGNPARLIGG